MAIHDANPTQLISRVAAELKKDATLKSPEWATFAKTGTSRERPPMQVDWWQTRAAAVLRKIYLRGPIGTSKLRNQFGGRKNMGMAPEHYCPGSGSVIRKILQQLEKAQLVKQAQKGVHKGRVVTPKGHQLLDRAAIDLLKEQGFVLPVKSPAQKASEQETSVSSSDSSSEKKPKVPRKPRAPRKKKEEKPAEPAVST